MKTHFIFHIYCCYPLAAVEKSLQLNYFFSVYNARISMSVQLKFWMYYKYVLLLFGIFIGLILNKCLSPLNNMLKDIIGIEK